MKFLIDLYWIIRMAFDKEFLEEMREDLEKH
jgi:hypothetical protein